MKSLTYYNFIKVAVLLFLASTLWSCKTNKKIVRDDFDIKELVFEKSTVIDEDLYNQSMQDFKEKWKSELKKSIIDEMKEFNEEIDEEKINLKVNSFTAFLGMVFSDMFFSGNELHFYKFQDSLIISYQIVNNKVQGDYRIINRNKNTFHYLSKVDSSSTYHNNTPYKYRSEKGLIIDEYRNEKKIIHGIECFKIVVTAQGDIDKDMPEFLRNFTTEYTMFVCDKIKNPFHPIIWYKTILDRYYPLEITESNRDIKGTVVKYELKLIK